MLPNDSAKRSSLFFDENLKLVSYCPLCNNHYNLLEARLLEEGDASTLFYIRCRHCQAAILSLVLNNSMGVSSVGLVTDLSPEEVLKYAASPEVTEGEILASYQDLQKLENVLELVG